MEAGDLRAFLGESFRFGMLGLWSRFGKICFEVIEILVSREGVGRRELYIS